MTSDPSSTPPAPSKPKTRLRTKLGLAVGATLLGLLVAEVVARFALGDRFVFGAHTGLPLTQVGRHDPLYGWTNRPDLKTWIVARRFGYDFDYHVQLNSHGMRGPEIERARAGGKFRVLLLGDSVTWGWGVNDDETYASILCRELGPDVEVVNAAVPGWGTDQVSMWLEREGGGWAPDLVVLCFIFNDIRSNGRVNIYGQNKPRFVAGPDGELVLEGVPVEPELSSFRRRTKWWRRRLAAYSALLRWSLLSDEPQTDGRAPMVRMLEKSEMESASPEQGEIQRRLTSTIREVTNPKAVTHQLLMRIRAKCDSLEAPLIVFGVPHGHDQYLYDPGHPLPEGSQAEPYLTPLSHLLRRAGRMLDFHTFSVDQAFLEEVREGTSLNCGDGHLNARGNELVAEILASELAPYVEGGKK